MCVRQGAWLGLGADSACFGHSQTRSDTIYYSVSVLMILFCWVFFFLNLNLLFFYIYCYETTYFCSGIKLQIVQTEFGFQPLEEQWV